jgi:hypothetical protein
MQNGLTTKQAIEQVMKGKRRPMKVREVIDAAVPVSGLARQDPGPGDLQRAHTEAKRPDGLVVQTGRGEFKLNPMRRKAA